MLKSHTYNPFRVWKLLGPLIVQLILTLLVALFFVLAGEMQIELIIVFFFIFSVPVFFTVHLVIKYIRHDQGKAVGIEYQKEMFYHNDGETEREIPFKRITSVLKFQGEGPGTYHFLPLGSFSYTVVLVKDENPVVYTSLLSDDLFNFDFDSITKKKYKFFPDVSRWERNVPG